MSLIQRAEASMERIHQFLQAEPVVHGPANGYKPEHIRGEWTFESVSFVYPDSGIEALRDFSLQVKPGELIVITGKTGSGKSTLVQLMVRSMDPTSGRILLDGVDLREWDLEYVRKQVAFVPQDAFLFSDTVAENLRFGNTTELSDSELVEAAQAAAVHDDVLGFEKGYETVVGERGVALSGGQKQRLSIARAFLKKAPVLVLDDSLSAVDPKTESYIVEMLPKSVVGRTAFVVAQRLSVAPFASQIVVLEEGKLIEKGNHKELLDKPGFYASLVEIQSRRTRDDSGEDHQTKNHGPFTENLR
jgi:ATP-binding cassette subfamily B protein